MGFGLKYHRANNNTGSVIFDAGYKARIEGPCSLIPLKQFWPWSLSPIYGISFAPPFAGGLLLIPFFS